MFAITVKMATPGVSLSYDIPVDCTLSGAIANVNALITTDPNATYDNTFRAPTESVVIDQLLINPGFNLVNLAIPFSKGTRIFINNDSVTGIGAAQLIFNEVLSS